MDYNRPRPIGQIGQQAGDQFEFDEKGQQAVDQLSKTNRQQAVDEIRHQVGDGLDDAIRQQLADGMKLFFIFAPINQQMNGMK